MENPEKPDELVSNGTNPPGRLAEDADMSNPENARGLAQANAGSSSAFDSGALVIPPIERTSQSQGDLKVAYAAGNRNENFGVAQEPAAKRK